MSRPEGSSRDEGPRGLESEGPESEGLETKGLKSAYEAALEKLESQGISRPDESSLTSESRQSMAEARRKATAKLAELEIMHRDSLSALHDPGERSQAEERYRLERRRVEEALEDELARLRRAR